MKVTFIYTLDFRITSSETNQMKHTNQRMLQSCFQQHNLHNLSIMSHI